MERPLVLTPLTSGTATFACGQQGEVSRSSWRRRRLDRSPAPLSPRGSLCAVSEREELEGPPPMQGRTPQGRAGSHVTGQWDSPAPVFLESSQERGSLREWGKGAPGGAKKTNGRAGRRRAADAREHRGWRSIGAHGQEAGGAGALKAEKRPHVGRKRHSESDT